MVNKEDIKNLASLARIELEETEAESLTKEIDSILGYVAVIQGITGEEVKSNPILRNVLREDVPTHTKGEYKEKLLTNAPSREGNYLKVKKIL